VTNLWHWHEYIETAADPLYGWSVPSCEMDFPQARKVFLSALSKLCEIHKMLINVPDLGAAYGGASTNTARVRMEDEIKEARKQIHIALLALQNREEKMSHYAIAHDDDPVFEERGTQTVPRKRRFLKTKEVKMKKNADWDKVLHDNHAEMGGDNEVDWEGNAIPIEEERKLVEEEKEIIDVLYPSKDKVDIDNRFTYHAPKGTQPERYEYLRRQARNLATDIVRNCPDSRERSLALTKLEEAIFWANASIARNE
jgi:hypothetical protein